MRMMYLLALVATTISAGAAVADSITDSNSCNNPTDAMSQWICELTINWCAGRRAGIK